MTREEALAEVPFQTGTIEGTEGLIHDIYNDFESRTCESCKWYIEEYTKRDNHCGKDGMWDLVEMLRCTKDFGCNKWRAKDD